MIQKKITKEEAYNLMHKNNLSIVEEKQKELANIVDGFENHELDFYVDEERNELFIEFVLADRVIYRLMFDIRKEREMIRVNTRISLTANRWLDDYSTFTGLPKSTIIMMAIENYIKEKESMDKITEMKQLIDHFEQLEKQMQRK